MVGAPVDPRPQPAPVSAPPPPRRRPAPPAGCPRTHWLRGRGGASGARSPGPAGGAAGPGAHLPGPRGWPDLPGTPTPVPRPCPWQRRSRGGGLQPHGSGAFLAVRASARKAGPWTRRRTPGFGARSPPLEDPTYPAARPPTPPRVPLLLGFYGNGRAVGSEPDSWRVRPPGPVPVLPRRPPPPDTVDGADGQVGGGQGAHHFQKQRERNCWKRERGRAPGREGTWACRRRGRHCPRALHPGAVGKGEEKGEEPGRARSAGAVLQWAATAVRLLPPPHVSRLPPRAPLLWTH